MRKLSLLATLLLSLDLYGCDSSADAPDPNGDETSNSEMVDDDQYTADLFGELDHDNLDQYTTSFEPDAPIEDENNERFDEQFSESSDDR